MIEKRIAICIGTDRAKHVRARLSLLVVENEIVLSEQYHSIALHPGANLAQIRAQVEAHIGNQNGGIPGAPWPKIPDAEWTDVEAHCVIVHKPEVIAKYLADQQARLGVLTKE